MRVPLKFANNAIVDVWCANVRAPNSETFLPNGGPYYGYDSTTGNPNPAGLNNAETCNSAEENLQITRLIAAVNNQATSTNRPAIVAALTYTSPQIGDDPNSPIITGLEPENFALFESPPWQELTAPNYNPQCTFCSDNPLNYNGVSSDKQWSVHLFGVGIGADSVTDTQRTYTSNPAKADFVRRHRHYLTSSVSQYYGIQSTVRVPQ